MGKIKNSEKNSNNYKKQPFRYLGVYIAVRFPNNLEEALDKGWILAKILGLD